MDIQNQALIAEIERFKTESLKTHVVKVWADSYENSDPFSYVILKNENNKVWWMKTQAHQLWQMWQAAKAQAVPEGFILMPIECTDEIAEAIAFGTHVCGGVANDVYESIIKVVKEQK